MDIPKMIGEINSVIWEKCPKDVICIEESIAVASAVIEYNHGSAAL